MKTKQTAGPDGNRSTFSSSIGFMLVAVGGAVGLGNIYSFPYKMGRGGGFPFLLLYIVSVVVLGIPLSMAEFGIGRKMRCGPVRAFRRLGRRWSVIGWLSTIACVGVMGYYCLTCGWVLKYAVMFALSCLGLAETFWAADSAAYFQSFIARPVEPILWTAAVMALTFLILRKNIAHGLERAGRFMMPALLVILVVVAVRSCTLPGAVDGLKYMFEPNAEAFRRTGGFLPVMSLALMQMFFSVNIGYNTNLICGSYMADGTSILRSALVIPLADMLIAVLAGLATIPALFAFGYEPTAGSGMLFLSLKSVFTTMPGGQFFGLIFFVAVLFACLTSTTAMTADIAAIPVDDWGWPEQRATLASAVVSVAIAAVVSLGYGRWSGLRPLSFAGLDYNVLDSIDFITQNFCANIAAFLMCLFIGWVWKPDALIAEIEKTGVMPPFLKRAFRVVIRYITPALTFLVVLTSLA